MASNWYHGRGGARFLPQTRGGKPIPSMSNKFGINMRVIGLNNVIKGFNYRMGLLYGRTREGLNIAVDYLETNMNTKPPMTPEDTGNLRDAWYKRIIDAPDGPKVEFGYEMDEPEPNGAPYAYYVHEMTSPPYGPINWTLPGSGPRWFQTHLKIDKEAMLYLIKIYAKQAVV